MPKVRIKWSIDCSTYFITFYYSSNGNYALHSSLYSKFSSDPIRVFVLPFPMRYHIQNYEIHNPPSH